MPKPQAAYDIVAIRYSTPTEHNAVWMIDLDGPLSVINDAEKVCADVHELYPRARIFYRDTAGHWDELVHRAGRFVMFAPARFAGHTNGGPIIEYPKSGEEARRG